MSLNVPDWAIDKSVSGEKLSHLLRMRVIAESFPLAIALFEGAIAKHKVRAAYGADDAPSDHMQRVGFIEFTSSDPDTMKQMAKLFAADAVRTEYEKWLSIALGCEVKTGFRLCCSAAIAVVGDAEAERRLAIFTSFESQVLAQRQDMVDC